MDKIKSFEDLKTLREKYKAKIANRTYDNADKNIKKNFTCMRWNRMSCFKKLRYSQHT